MKTSVARRRGFTLIELLMVIAVIGILALIVFKLMGYAGRASAKANTIAMLRAYSQALEEFKAEYGVYPPATNYFEYERAHTQPAAVYDYFRTHPNDTTHVLWVYGLYWYLFGYPADGKIRTHTQHSAYRPISARDSNAMARWTNYLRPYVKELPDMATRNLNSVGLNLSYQNRYTILADDYQRPLIYQCNPPFQTYTLYSQGADISTAEDDIYATTKWDTK